MPWPILLQHSVAQAEWMPTRDCDRRSINFTSGRSAKLFAMLTKKKTEYLPSVKISAEMKKRAMLRAVELKRTFSNYLRLLIEQDLEKK